MVVDIEAIRHKCPRCLKHFLDIPDEDSLFTGWAAPARDDSGRLTFPKTFGIPRRHFAACISYLRSGHIEYLGPLVETFEILGGCKCLDNYVETLRQKELEQDAYIREQKEAMFSNPARPEFDTRNRYVWRAGVANWTPPNEDWTTTVLVDTSATNIHPGSLFWWRSTKSVEQEDY